jgi:16S rRNA (uracil1498-N3)-methyltransferase
VTVLDGAGTQLTCEVADVTRKKVELAVRQRTHVPQPPFQVALLQAIVKGKTMDTIIQKSTELGVARIVPLQTERVVAQLDRENAEHKQDKWQLTAIEALKQCGSPWLPQIDPPVTLSESLGRMDAFDLSLVGSLQGDGRPLYFWFDEFVSSKHEPPGSVAVWIGPEGDFTDAELDAIRASGARPITLGQLVLRADTAAIFSVSVIRHELERVSATARAL